VRSDTAATRARRQQQPLPTAALPAMSIGTASVSSKPTEIVSSPISVSMPAVPPLTSSISLHSSTSTQQQQQQQQSFALRSCVTAHVCAGIVTAACVVCSDRSLEDFNAHELANQMTVDEYV
jgi:hypothetical protein